MSSLSLFWLENRLDDERRGVINEKAEVLTLLYLSGAR